MIIRSCPETTKKTLRIQVDYVLSVWLCFRLRLIIPTEHLRQLH
ncbi:UNVERIFIED_CONTAM: hypothetical protein GTU68_035677 [Idotea baltica]|nr:hypothetical protein [Idotea baltica]